VKTHYYSAHAAALRTELGRTIPRQLLRDLHTKDATRHLAIAARQFAILALATWGLITIDNPAFWIPLAIVQGFTVFNFTVLLHEVVHHTVFATRRPAAERALAWLYAVPSGISASQFTRWHLDHHAELGSDEDDPKRRHLSPKRNARWFKLLYCTPALFPIYFRAARRESATYPPALQAQIARERRVAILAHLSVLAGIWTLAGGAAALRAHVIPVFFVFPIAFTLNRLGQHYDIDPADPAKWGTLMRGSWFWDFAFLNSNYHLEHHYFAGVPFYHLPELQRALVPFYERHGMRWRTYPGLLRDWFLRNCAPHTNWESGHADPGARPLGSVTRVGQSSGGRWRH
jgi:fatty acid desaturase